MRVGDALARGAVALGTWWLVQVPAKDMPLAPPGSNMPPITKFKKVREFPSAGECEAYRDVALQDGAMMGSEAMLDETSTLRCVAAEQLAPPTPAATP
jgi:hypothetical protein